MAAPSGLGPLLPGMQAGDRARSLATRSVKDLVRKHLDLDPDAPVFVAEVACGEADCPDTETVIAVLEAAGRREFRIAKAVSAVTGADIAAALP